MTSSNNLIFSLYMVALLTKNMKLIIWQKKMYVYYVEVPRNLIFGSNFPFTPPVEFLEIFQFFLHEHISHTYANFSLTRSATHGFLSRMIIFLIPTFITLGWTRDNAEMKIAVCGIWGIEHAVRNTTYK